MVLTSDPDENCFTLTRTRIGRTRPSYLGSKRKLSIMSVYDHSSLRLPEEKSLDSQSKSLNGALKDMGNEGRQGARKGKYFELTLDGGLSREEAQSGRTHCPRISPPPSHRRISLFPVGLTLAAEPLRLPYAWHCRLSRQKKRHP
jgi:hypothetical protein